MPFTHRALVDIPCGRTTIRQGDWVDASAWPNRHLLERADQIAPLDADERREANKASGRAPAAADVEAQGIEAPAVARKRRGRPPRAQAESA